MNFTIKRNDTRSGLKATLLDANGAAVNLTGAKVKFIMAKLDRTAKVNRTAEILNAAAGQVRHVFQVGDTDTPGMFAGEFEVTYPDGGVESFPNTDYIRILIESDLG